MTTHIICHSVWLVCRMTSWWWWQDMRYPPIQWCHPSSDVTRRSISAENNKSNKGNKCWQMNHSYDCIHRGAQFIVYYDNTLPWQHVTMTKHYRDNMSPWHHVSMTTHYHDNTLSWQHIVFMTTLLYPWQQYCYPDITAVTMTILLLLWQHYCNHDNTTVTMTTQLLPWQHYCYYDNTAVIMATLLLSWQHYCY